MTEVELYEALQEAVHNQTLQVYYQPIVSLRDGHITGFEALARWRHKGHHIPPSRFIRLAEQSTLIIAVDDLILRHACRQLKLWREAELVGPEHFISVNLSVRALDDPQLTTRIPTILKDHVLPSGNLHLELAVGTAALSDTDISTLATLRAQGIRCALGIAETQDKLAEDLAVLPVDIVKVRQQDENRLQHFIHQAHDQGIRVVAEGVEDESLVRRLLNLRCEFAQGYYFSPPIDALRAGRMLAGDPRWRRVLH